MAYARKLSRKTRRHILALLTPSLLSSFVASSTALALTFGLFAVFVTHGPTLLPWQPDNTLKPLTTPDQVVDAPARPGLTDSWPLFLIWCLVGLLSYAIAAFIVHTITEAYTLERSLEHDHVDGVSMFEAIIERVLLRLLAAAILVGLFILFVSRIVPYGVRLIRHAATDTLSLETIASISLVFIIVYACLHMQAIFLRLAAGSVRIFR